MVRSDFGAPVAASWAYRLGEPPGYYRDRPNYEKLTDLPFVSKAHRSRGGPPPPEPWNSPTRSALDHDRINQRLIEIWERTGDEALRRLSEGQPPHGDAVCDATQRADWISTCLMDTYKRTGDRLAFALLFDLNERSFMQAIVAKTRRSSTRVDPHDVLQEVFLNIYRYPHRFLADKPDSFRNWGHRIARNTLLKFFKGQSRHSQFAALTDDIGQREDVRVRTPYRSALESESADLVDWAYLIYLNLYLIHFEQLSAKEKRALTLVEIEGASYKQAARELGIRLENLKMVIFRGRRKILRNLNKTLEDLNARQSLPVLT